VEGRFGRGDGSRNDTEVLVRAPVATEGHADSDGDHGNDGDAQAPGDGASAALAFGDGSRQIRKGTRIAGAGPA
jgi:hypothetical protein